ncbi:RelA/SpoT domain-containing protein [Paraflavitalea speifideaquila]|uniref:RelA/SpoT domain-containing protein n=1 Tax=Paraflavitalea speifideaquila TaxID=3076558 RepID=UPI0028E218BA|nr:RelA/SpoT domain-containing protein [Paraflavitalea speifideiaquila]
MTLDSMLEIAFKEYLVNDSGISYSAARLENIMKNRTDVHNEVKNTIPLTIKHWKKIEYYYKLRCELVHKRATVTITDDDLINFRKTVEYVLAKMFNLSFKRINPFDNSKISKMPKEMSDIISENISRYKALSIIYNDTIYDSLKEPRAKLEGIFIALLDNKGQEYALQKNNSVYAAKYYHVKSRIKATDNFYEKLIRKNIGLTLTNKYDLIQNEENLNLKKGEIITDIQNLDDIIGLRIVTELKKDCVNVYELLENSGDFFQEKQIKFKDLKGQPQKMKNGLDIYRIKGIFQGIFGFELQIKSKIDEAWGELDHTLFYKDYSISPIKDTVQVTMNNVGELLDRIEYLLYDLRESGSNYIENAEHLKFQEELEHEISVLLKEKFETPYRLKEIAHYLKYFRDKLGVGEVRLDSIGYNHLEWAGASTFTNSYIKIRNSNFDLLLIETLYLNWKN